MKRQTAAIADPWGPLRQLTSARIALGRAGGSLPTHELLDFQLAHARARDAVNHPFDTADLKARIEQLGLPALILQTAAQDRLTYLKRPDLGRRLSDPSRDALAIATDAIPAPDLVILVCDGLSALAVHRQSVPVLEALAPKLRSDGWRLAPIVIVCNGRVALQDEVGGILGAELAMTLIGERPGLGAPDSLGAYLVHGPRPGLTDADRNCVSNIRPEGLPPAAAAAVLQHLLTAARRLQVTGVKFKVDMTGLPTPVADLPNRLQ